MSQITDDYRHCACFDGFENAATMGENRTKVILRVLKYHLEEYLKIEMCDDAFAEIVNVVPFLQPARPFGAYSTLGYIQPLKKILDRYGLSEIQPMSVLHFFLFRTSVDRYYRNILLHVPHSSTVFPEGVRYSFADLPKEERLLIDYYTDELFIPEPADEYITSAVFPYCRLYCDVERLAKDPLEKDGLGISYSRLEEKGIPFSCRRAVSIHSYGRMGEVFDYYADFHARVEKQLVKLKDKVLLIDCHSFSSLPNRLNQNPPDIDICIGYNYDDGTKPDDVALGNIIHHFKSRGYKVGINTPFSNSKTFQVPTDYHSVMIEVNKRLYMDEETLAKTDGFDRLRDDIQSVYGLLHKDSPLNSVRTSGPSSDNQ